MFVSKIEFEILDHLRSGKGMYGLELVKASSLLKRGSIYVFLQRMQDKGWVTSEQEKQESVPGMPRRIYTISAEGRRSLAIAEQVAALYRGAGAGKESFV